MIDAFASQRQYVDHLVWLWKHIPNPGSFIVYPSLERHARNLGVTPTRSRGEVIKTSLGASRGPILVASYVDERLVRSNAPDRPIVFVEHGAGQHYGDSNPSHPGGSDRDAVALFICPNETVAERNRAVYPNAKIAVTGSPRLEQLAWMRVLGGSGDRVVCGWHWDNGIWPESRSAFREYQTEVARLSTEIPMLGSGHPRMWSRFSAFYRRNGIQSTPDWAEALSRAEVYVCDNSSTLFEAAALDVPVVVVNSKQYRKNVDHGLRFWTWADIGPQVDHPMELGAAIHRARFEDVWSDRRAQMREAVYGQIEGAGRRAAEAVASL